jgi:hypothetical protein
MHVYMACCDFSGFCRLGKHVVSIVKVMALVVDFVTSYDGNHINDGQMRGHTISQECVCVCVCREKPA